ncbi:phosphatase 2C-like domain-containing protein [Mycena olivaceomarginata]|nr:phosphatase 2C-like domain-containing protein [Mycena olivaceomarginata]
MVLRSAKKCLSLPTLAIPRPWLATRIALGVSASIYLASLNNLHGDSESDEEPSASPSPDRSTDIEPAPFGGGFTVDQTQWPLPIRYLGDPPPPGVMRMYWYSRFDTRIRAVTRGPRVLMNILDGDFVARANVSDVLAQNLWFNLESLFKWYQIDHTNPQPVEFLHEPHPPPEAIQSQIKIAVKFTDDFILKHFIGRVFSSLSKKYAPDGIRSTASARLISALYEDDVRLLHVVSLGDMRALLGRPRTAEDGTVKYDVHVLSVDHTPDNPVEKARIEKLHPGEDVIEDGKLFDRPYTRALGDGKLKWDVGVQTRLHNDYLGAAPDPKVKTPPYIDTEPDVTTIKILPGDFLILSSRYLGECLTDEEVVGLVGVWLEKNRSSNLYLPLDEPPPPDPTPGVVITPEELPVDLKEDKTVMYRRWNVPKRFICTDQTPTMHLATNAMGGADSALRQALSELLPPESEGNTSV